MSALGTGLYGSACWLAGIAYGYWAARCEWKLRAAQAAALSDNAQFLVDVRFAPVYVDGRYLGQLGDFCAQTPSDESREYGSIDAVIRASGDKPLARSSAGETET